MLQGLIHHAPIINSRLFLNHIPRGIARSPTQKGIFFEIHGLPPIPDAEGTGLRSGLDGKWESEADQTKKTNRSGAGGEVEIRCDLAQALHEALQEGG